MSTQYEQAMGWIQQQLAESGFKAKSAVAEPAFPETIEGMEIPDLKRLYDAFLNYYQYIADHGFRSRDLENPNLLAPASRGRRSEEP